MEIGYATALGIPVVVVTTDFQTYSAADDSTRWEFPDPLIEVVAQRIIRVDRLGTPGPEASRDRFAAFAARNQAQIDTAAASSIEAILELAANSPGTSVTSGTHVGHASIEPSPHTPQPETLFAALEAASFSVTTASRHRTPGPVTAARADWTSALHSEVLVADLSGPETPPGAALLIGAATALRRRIGAYLPTTTLTHAQGREPNWRNLMIQYAVGSRIRDRHDLASWLASWLAS